MFYGRSTMVLRSFYEGADRTQNGCRTAVERSQNFVNRSATPPLASRSMHGEQE